MVITTTKTQGGLTGSLPEVNEKHPVEDRKEMKSSLYKVYVNYKKGVIYNGL